MPGCSAFKNPISLTLVPNEAKYNVNKPHETPNTRLLTSEGFRKED